MLYLTDLGIWRITQGGMKVSQGRMVAFTGSQEVISKAGKQAQWVQVYGAVCRCQALTLRIRVTDTKPEYKNPQRRWCVGVGRGSDQVLRTSELSRKHLDTILCAVTERLEALSHFSKTAEASISA